MKTKDPVWRSTPEEITITRWGCNETGHCHTSFDIAAKCIAAQLARVHKKELCMDAIDHFLRGLPITRLVLNGAHFNFIAAESGRAVATIARDFYMTLAATQKAFPDNTFLQGYERWCSKKAQVRQNKGQWLAALERMEWEIKKARRKSKPSKPVTMEMIYENIKQV